MGKFDYWLKAIDYHRAGKTNEWIADRLGLRLSAVEELLFDYHCKVQEGEK